MIAQPVRTDSPSSPLWNLILEPLRQLSLRDAHVLTRDEMLNIVGIIRQAERLDDNLRGPGLADRISEGLCAIVGTWCLTHNVPEDPGHALDTKRLDTLD
jgi:hypothetical protein